MADLFTAKYQEDVAKHAPLADRMRPQTLDDFVGQETVVGPKTILRRAIANDELFSMIFWGPPGSGKTTLARIIANLTKSEFVPMSGVLSSKDDLLKAVRKAEERRKLHQQRTILFVDEIHRWNKAQQDALLPFVENGLVILIGATTENPSFEVISPLLSRCRVLVLERLSPDHLRQIVDQALTDRIRGYGNWAIVVEPTAMELLTTAANGDARTALNILEISIKATKATKNKKTITLPTVTEAFQKPQLLYDKSGDEHFNVISAFIKSLRGSDPDAALYWLGRMVAAGEDPLFIARRMVIFASEDVSLADVHALPLAIACMQACDLVGLPECAINLSHVAVYLATCPKSNETYVAYNQALEDVRSSLNEPVPLHLRNAPTKLMKDLGYHRGYKYSHNYPTTEGQQEYLPTKLNQREYYQPLMNANAKRCVTVVPFRKHHNQIEIWVGNKKSIDGSQYWQCVRGAVEAGESPRQAAGREIQEEINVRIGEWQLIDLKRIYSFIYHGHKITERAFAVEIGQHPVKISDEHTEFKWVTPDQAQKIFSIPDHRDNIRALIKLTPNP